MGFGALVLLGIIGILRLLHFLHQDTLSVTFQLWFFPVDAKDLGDIVLVQFEIYKDGGCQKSFKQHGRCHHEQTALFHTMEKTPLHVDTKIALAAINSKEQRWFGSNLTPREPSGNE